MIVVFRVDSSAQIGSGHFYRSLTLAVECLLQDIDVFFISRVLLPEHKRILETKSIPFAQISYPGAFSCQQDYLAFKQVCHQHISTSIDCVFIDHYKIDFAWHKSVREFIPKIFVIDDLADRCHLCDFLLDQNFYIDSEIRYNNLLPPESMRFLGPAYSLLRDEFYSTNVIARFRNKVPSRKSILIFFGSTDPTAQTLNAVKAISLFRPNYFHKVHVIIGSSNARRDQIIASTNNSLFCIHDTVSNISSLMLDVDFAIGAAGSSLWERCFLGLPTIVCSLADNQLQTALDLASKQVIYFIGSDLELSIELYYKAILKLSTDDSLLASLTKNSLSLFSSEPSFRAKSYIVDTVRQAILQQQ